MTATNEPTFPSGTQEQFDAEWATHVAAQHQAEKVRKHKGGYWVEVVVCKTCERAYVVEVGEMPGAKARLQRLKKRLTGSLA